MDFRESAIEVGTNFLPVFIVLLIILLNNTIFLNYDSNKLSMSLSKNIKETEIQLIFLKWYSENQRDLPWRTNKKDRKFENKKLSERALQKSTIFRRVCYIYVQAKI